MSIIDKMKFRQPAYLGDVLTYYADITQINELKVLKFTIFLK